MHGDSIDTNSINMVYRLERRPTQKGSLAIEGMVNRQPRAIRYPPRGIIYVVANPIRGFAGQENIRGISTMYQNSKKKEVRRGHKKN